jgi:hypothetical protein
LPLHASNEQLRQFMRRDRARVTEADREHWRSVLRTGGPSAIWALGDAMLDDLRAIDPSWPSPEARQRDLAHHVFTKRRIDAAAAAFLARTRTR